MRRLVWLLAAATAVGWAANRLFQGSKKGSASALQGAARNGRTAGGVPKKRTASGLSRAARTDSSCAVRLQQPDTDSVVPALPDEEIAPEPANVIELEAFRKQRQRQRTAGGPPTAPGKQTEKARMKLARDAVDERFRSLPKKGDDGGRAVA
jgi:hypothetical protein